MVEVASDVVIVPNELGIEVTVLDSVMDCLIALLFDLPTLTELADPVLGVVATDWAVLVPNILELMKFSTGKSN